MAQNEGVPLWLKLAPQVRAAMLAFQQIVATRNDLGTLASMHNKFVRIALVRLRLSIQEWLGELPPETEKLMEEVTGPDVSAPVRLFLPTRPTLLGKGERVELQNLKVVVEKPQEDSDERLAELGFDPELAWKEAQRCLNCDVQTVFTGKLCIECDACVDICPVDCITFTGNSTLRSNYSTLLNGSPIKNGSLAE